MFLEIEGNNFINLTAVSRIELYHAEHKRYARLYTGGAIEVESHMAYAFFMDPANAAFLMVPRPLAPAVIEETPAA